LAQELNVSPFVSSAAKPVLTQTIYENDRWYKPFLVVQNYFSQAQF
jgi:hypothetical protein